ncbi:hypothetical protein P7C73_g1649, partial [Tremellales sp. Uapishka_1]
MTVTNSKLFSPVKIGSVQLKHRVVMAPLTRVRASDQAVPGDLAIEYYSQRASDGGLIITEAAYIADEARGMATAPGLYTKEQLSQWTKIADAVHAKGGKIFAQLWAAGRTADPKVVGKVFGPSKDTYEGTEVNEMSEADIARYVEHYKQAAINSVAAGLDGVEIHGANGYLQSPSNKRTDSYGGSIENRFRFPLQVLNAVCEAIGADKVGIRTAPFTQFQGMREADPLSVFVPWTKAIIKAQPGLAYIHAVTGRDGITTEHHQADTLDPIRDALSGSGVQFLIAGSFNPETAKQQAQSTDDLVVFGRYFISTPDLPYRIANDLPINKYNRDTFYTQGPVGYTDYPEWSESLKKDTLVDFKKDEVEHFK